MVSKKVVAKIPTVAAMEKMIHRLMNRYDKLLDLNRKFNWKKMSDTVCAIKEDHWWVKNNIDILKNDGNKIKENIFFLQENLKNVTNSYEQIRTQLNHLQIKRDNKRIIEDLFIEKWPQLKQLEGSDEPIMMFIENAIAERIKRKF